MITVKKFIKQLNNTELGKKAKGYMDAGQLVPDELVVDLVVDRIKAADCMKGFILEKYYSIIS